MPTRGVDIERPRCPGCGVRAVPATAVLCRDCWTHVPPDLRTAVRGAQKAWNTDPTDEAWALLQECRTLALDSLPGAQNR